jgi:uncharacterized membrane protein
MSSSFISFNLPGGGRRYGRTRYYDGPTTIFDKMMVSGIIIIMVIILLFIFISKISSKSKNESFVARNRYRRRY